MKTKEHSHLRRLAIQIVSQLPDNTPDALAVLDHARDLEFLDEPETEVSDNVTAFPANGRKGELIMVTESKKTLAKTMFLEIGRKRFQVTSFEQASCMFCAARYQMGEGASRTPSPKMTSTNEARQSPSFPTTGASGLARSTLPTRCRCTTTAERGD